MASTLQIIIMNSHKPIQTITTLNPREAHFLTPTPPLTASPIQAYPYKYSTKKVPQLAQEALK